MRRGLESTSIYSIDFDYFDTWIVCVCKTDTVHLWKLDITEVADKDWKIKKWFSSIFSEEKAFAKQKLPNLKYPFVAFDHTG